MHSAALRILVVQGDSETAPPMERSLLELGYEVAGVAGSGREAIRMAQASAPDVVLIDLELGGEIDGVTTAEEIHRCCRSLVIFVSANTDAHVRSRRGSLPYRCLMKPLDRDELNSALSGAVEQHRLWQEISNRNTWLSLLLGSISDAVIATDAHALLRFLN